MKSPLIIALLLSAQITRSDSISLVVWVEDDPPQKALSSEMFEKARSSWDELGIQPRRDVFIGRSERAALLEKVAASLSPEDRIGHLILATHGRAHLWWGSNSVLLDHFGGLSERGAFGTLSNLIQAVGPRLDHELRLSFVACRAGRGSLDQVQNRLAGLHAQCAPFQVKRISLFGPCENAVYQYDRPAMTADERAQQLNLLKFPRMMAWPGAGVLEGLIHYSFASEFTFHPVFLKSSVMVGSGCAVAFFIAMSAKFLWQVTTKRISDRGILSSTDGEVFEMLEIKAGTPEAFRAEPLGCAGRLVRKETG